MALKLLYIALGGGIGSLLRYLVSGIIQKSTSSIFPYGTLAVNIIGAFLIGFLWDLFQDIIIPNNVRMLIFIGLLGAFTTFSTFSLETLNLIRGKESVQALVNIVITNMSCLIFVFLGSASAKLLIKFIFRGKL
jgi:fluoride exporter